MNKKNTLRIFQDSDGNTGPDDSHDKVHSPVQQSASTKNISVETDLFGDQTVASPKQKSPQRKMLEWEVDIFGTDAYTPKQDQKITLEETQKLLRDKTKLDMVMPEIGPEEKFPRLYKPEEDDAA
jgi:hypothetical protein